ncbi:MAG TPA: hypothetical protein VGJ37_18150 [Pyrinomonadaceae bacterium]|jgi:hypothetical protein
MTDNYEAAEVLVIGRAQDVILGVKTEPILDNRSDPDTLHQDSALAMFDE